jgi:hypothetical protein
MAGTDDDPSTDDWAEFRLLRTEYIFILDELTHSKELAEKVVRAFLEEGEYDRFTGRRRYRLWMVEVLPGGAPSPYSGEFWRSDPEHGIECKIDCLNSSARWTGPTSAVWRASGRETAEYRITMIWVSHGAMLDFLRRVGWSLGRAQPDKDQQELPLSEPIHSSPTASESPEQSPNTAGDAGWPSAQALGIEGDRLQKAILAALPELYAKHPESFGDWKVYRHGGKRLASAVGKLWADKARGMGKPPPHAPSEDTAGRLLKAYRAWAANQRAK